MKVQVNTLPKSDVSTMTTLPRLFDSHAHLNDPRFSPDLSQVLQRARDAGICGIINVGFDLGSSRLAVEQVASEPDFYAAVGVHPHDAADVDETCLDAIERLAGNERVVAIGETGLDYFRNLAPPQVQRTAFEQFIALAGRLGLPLIVHCREAHTDVLKVLDASIQPGQTVIMHCFAGDMQFAEKCLERDFYLGISGTVTYPKSTVLRQVAACCPDHRILLETDCPWLPPQPYRGKRNEPAFVCHVAETVATERGLSTVEIAALTAANAQQAFGLR